MATDNTCCCLYVATDNTCCCLYVATDNTCCGTWLPTTPGPWSCHNELPKNPWFLVRVAAWILRCLYIEKNLQVRLGTCQIPSEFACLKATMVIATAKQSKTEMLGTIGGI